MNLARAAADLVPGPMLTRWISGPASLLRVLKRRSSCTAGRVGPNGAESQNDSTLIICVLDLAR